MDSSFLGFIGKLHITMYRNPSPPPGTPNDPCPPSSQVAQTVTPLILTLVTAIQQNVVDEVSATTFSTSSSPSADFYEDSPFERTLCAIWDVLSVEEYA